MPLLIMLVANGQPARGGQAWSSDEAAVLLWLNEARTRPADFARRHIVPRGRRVRAAAECAAEMSRQAPLAPLTMAMPLVRSAKDHALDQSRSGATGHQGVDGSTLAARVERHGKWTGTIGENLYYGQPEPLEVVIEWLIDDGVRGRGHRRMILD